ncbi:MAG: KpsF/GutQ family sugar-phosphate isomerase [Proteobacteria bacterium]|nr:KpsF/GutQ family sugar-phosphate isomerase [Pseudomonadota bacterium]
MEALLLFALSPGWIPLAEEGVFHLSTGVFIHTTPKHIMDVLADIKEVISLEIKSLEELFQTIDESFERAVDLIMSSSGKIIISGMGKSGLIARKIAATFSSTGTTAVFLHPSEALHGDLGMVERGDTLVLLGKSGESDEMVGMLSILKKMHCKIIAITANKGSTLAKHSDIVLYTPIEQEACALNLAPTCSTTSALVVGDALAVTLMKRKNFSRQDYALFHPGGRLGKRLLLKVADLMRSGDENPVVHMDENFISVVSTISKGQENAVSVVDDKGDFKGLITGYDLRKAFLMNNNSKELTAKDIMNENPTTITKDVDAIDAFDKIRDNPKPLLLLPVLEGTKAIGIISMQSMIRAGL